jgi:hypothetical protein
MLDALMCSLYELAVRSSKESDEDKTLGGHQFEERVARLIYAHEKIEGLKAQQPRLTLQLPTISGLAYQFDASFSFRDALFVIECKKRRSLLTGSELVHYFSSKILDYVLASEKAGRPMKMRGIFLSTQDTGESGTIYGLSFGVMVIDPSHPPVPYMLSTLSQEENALRQSLVELDEKMTLDFTRHAGNSPSKVYEQYQFLRKRWKGVVGSSPNI